MKKFLFFSEMIKKLILKYLFGMRRIIYSLEKWYDIKSLASSCALSIANDS